MSQHRYFIADPSGLTYRALSAMEAAGAHIVKALNTIDEAKKIIEPVRVVLDGRLVGFSALPSSSRQDLQERQIQQQALVSTFRQTAQVFANMIDAPLIILSEIEFKDGTPFLSFNQKIRSAFDTISDNMSELGLDQNIAVRICEVGELENRPVDQNPEKAMLTLNHYSFYPEARRVFATWVIKMPPYIPAAGNDFVPPDCREISSSEFSSLINSLEFDDFCHDHEHARERILMLKKVDISSTYHG